MASCLYIVLLLMSLCALGQEPIQATTCIEPSAVEVAWLTRQDSMYSAIRATTVNTFEDSAKSQNEEVAYITLIIKPLLWKAWWVRLLLVSLLVSGLYGIYQYRMHRLKQRQELEFAISIKAQELERERFAKELHDGIGANLAMLRMYLATLGSPNIPIDELKRRSMGILKTSLDDIRSIIHDMHPQSLAQAGLAQAVFELVAHLQDNDRLNVRFHTEDVPVRLPESIEINLFRIIQELLQNALKHAEASNVWLQLSQQNNMLMLTYQDNGCGLDQSLANQSLGHGLLNIRQRIAVLKGTYQCRSAEPKGTTFKIVIPLPC